MSSWFEMVAESETERSEAMGVPLMRLVVRKAEGGKRWGGLIESIGEDSILQ